MLAKDFQEMACSYKREISSEDMNVLKLFTAL